jgi:hypothetical protein
VTKTTGFSGKALNSSVLLTYFFNRSATVPTGTTVRAQDRNETPMSKKNQVRRTVLSAAALVGLIAQPAAAAVELLSHRAVYQLSLAQGTSTMGGVSDVRGGLVMEWRDSCEGAISNQRLGFVASLADAPGFTYDVRFSSWESPDNKHLRFNVRSFDGGILFEEYQGEATLDEAGGKAAFAKPAGESLALPRGTLFPTEHMLKLVEGAMAGEVVVSHDVFDGSGMEGLSRVTAVIGRPTVVDSTATDAADERRWPVSLAYHDVTAADDVPSFELTFQLSEHGVLYDLVLDYGDFALQADLEQLETFEAPRCP